MKGHKAKSRFRERLTPPPVFGKVVAGKLLKYKVSDDKLVSSEDLIDFPSVSNQLIERTWDSINPGPPYRTGGSFTNIKVELPQFSIQGSGSYKSVPWALPGGPFYFKYDGGWVNPSFAGDLVQMAKYDQAGLDVPPTFILIPDTAPYCSEVYKRLRPQLEKAGLSVALAEARDIPRMMQTSARGFHDIWKSIGGNSVTPLMQPKKLADQFLNQQFGWAPFISDLRKFDNVYQNSGRYIDEITRKNNMWTKRVKKIKYDETSKLITRNYTLGCFPVGQYIESLMIRRLVNGNLCYGVNELHEVIKTDVWCEGSFKYYRPEFDRNLAGYDSAWNGMQRQMMLYGARLNPSVVYKATPWSWLIDWFINVGDVIDRANDWAYDSMVSKYIYLMHHYTREVKFLQTMHLISGDKTLEWVRSCEVKRRQQADNPYNFCLTWSALTARQLAILAALGISRKG